MSSTKSSARLGQGIIMEAIRLLNLWLDKPQAEDRGGKGLE